MANTESVRSSFTARTSDYPLRVTSPPTKLINVSCIRCMGMYLCAAVCERVSLIFSFICTSEIEGALESWDGCAGEVDGFNFSMFLLILCLFWIELVVWTNRIWFWIGIYWLTCMRMEIICCKLMNDSIVWLHLSIGYDFVIQKLTCWKYT